jgi:hypothetical protein
MRMTVVVFLSLLVVACGDAEESAAGDQTSGGEALVGSCNAISSVGVCEEYRGPIPAEALQNRQARCAQHGGQYSVSPCPTEGVLGSCIALAPAEAGRIQGTSVYGAAYTPNGMPVAQGQCTNAGGTWTAR